MPTKNSGTPKNTAVKKGTAPKNGATNTEQKNAGATTPSASSQNQPASQNPAAKKGSGSVTQNAAQSSSPAARSNADVVGQNAVQPTTNTTNASSEAHNSPALDYEAIRRRAYELYEQRGRTHGRHDEDWYRAEREIRDRARGRAS
jgi:hypothetical protein